MVAVSADKWDFGLRPPRAKASNPALTSLILKTDLVLRLGLLVFLPNRSAILGEDVTCDEKVQFQVPCASELYQPPELAAVLCEQLIMVVFLAKLARWEDQGHWVTVWQVLGSLITVSIRRSFYAQPELLLVAVFLLWAQYFIGVGTEFSQICEPRLPPFPPKQADTSKPRHGWLGKSLAQKCKNRCVRLLITFFVYISGRAFGIFLLYSFFIADVDTLQGLDGNLEKLLWVAAFSCFLSLVPQFSVELASIPGLCWDWLRMRRSSRAYKTGLWDITEIDDDLKEDGELRKKLDTHKCLPLTIVIPCYMPNEKDILEEVLDFYEEQLKHYPGESKVLIVWNSPQNHPEVEDALNKRVESWPNKGLIVKRNMWSTSKCDNLNMACDFIDTEMALLNDADTMVHWGTMVRASMWIGDEGYDIAQSVNTHNRADCIGMPGDEGEQKCHPYGVLITIGDGTKPQNMATQNMRSHTPFNGRGGFWRSSALKKVGFDHHTVGEDHDAAYRGCAYYGFKGILDNNMLCQEQEPPDCDSMVKQRIRWETAALEMRRTFMWILLSPHYTKWEAWVLIWSQLTNNCNLPLQSLPLQIASALPIVILKGYLSRFVFGVASTEAEKRSLCDADNCVVEFDWVTPLLNHEFHITLSWALLAFGGVLLLYVVLAGFDFFIRVLSTRYSNKAMFLCYFAFLKSAVVVPLFVYLQFWALYDYCWGGAKFIATARSPPSAKKTEDLSAPLLKSSA